MGTSHPMDKYYAQNDKRKRPSDIRKEPIKVKYVSSPVLVNAKTATEFRAIVQELTGKTIRPKSLGNGKCLGNVRVRRPALTWSGVQVTVDRPAVAFSRLFLGNENASVVNSCSWPLYGTIDTKPSHEVDTVDWSSIRKPSALDEDFFLEELLKCSSEFGLP